MRNYLKLLFMRWNSSNSDTLFAFGGDDDDLLTYVLRMEDFYRQTGGDPNVTFQRTAPQILWVELNQENLVRLFNRGQLSAFDIFVATRLNNGDFTINTFPNDTFYDMTRVEQEGSPRKTWSHGH